MKTRRKITQNGFNYILTSSLTRYARSLQSFVFLRYRNTSSTDHDKGFDSSFRVFGRRCVFCILTYSASASEQSDSMLVSQSRSLLRFPLVIPEFWLNFVECCLEFRLGGLHNRLSFVFLSLNELPESSETLLEGVSVLKSSDLSDFSSPFCIKISISESGCLPSYVSSRLSATCFAKSSDINGSSSSWSSSSWASLCLFAHLPRLLLRLLPQGFGFCTMMLVYPFGFPLFPVPTDAAIKVWKC